jgi:hypothetical protein
MNWATLAANANAVMIAEFGEPVVYQPVQSGAAAGSPFTVTAVRHARLPEESGAVSNFEEISVNPADFSNPPVKGDWISAWGTQYSVSAVRQPDAYGMISLTLLQRT